MSTETNAKSGAVNTVRAALGIGGILALIAGIVVLVWPMKSAFIVVGIIALYAIAAGLVYAALGLFSKGKGGWARIGHIVLGLLFIIGGILALANLPSATKWFALFFGIFVGIGWIIEGIVSLSTLGDASSKGWTLFFALVSVIAGIMLITSPMWGAAILWLLIGLSLVVLGLLQIVRAFTFKGETL